MSETGTPLEEGKYVYCIIKSPKERDFGPIDEFVRENVFTRRIEDSDGCIADHGGKLLVVDSVHVARSFTNANGTEIPFLGALDNAVYVFALFQRRPRFTHLITSI